MNLRICVANK